MTFTFGIEGIEHEDGDELPCPECLLSMRQNRMGQHSPMNCLCMGYGGPENMPGNPFELNVANENGYDILAALGLPVDCCGDADPRDILTALVAAEVLPRYSEKLSKIATKAAKYDRRVVWG